MFKFKFFVIIRSLVFLFLFYLLAKNYYKVNSIECFVDQESATVELCQQLDVLKGKSLFFTNFDQEDIFTQLASDEEQSKSYFVEEIKKQLPDKLVIYFSHLNPVYRLVDKNNKIYLVSEKGRLKNNQEELLVPIIQIDQNYQQEDHNQQSVRSDLHNYLQKLLSSLESNNLSAKRVIFSEYNQVKLYLSTDQEVLLEQDNQPEVAVEKLRIILNDQEVNSIENKVKEIDLRFNLPVLKT